MATTANTDALQIQWIFPLTMVRACYLSWWNFSHKYLWAIVSSPTNSTGTMKSLHLLIKNTGACNAKVTTLVALRCFPLLLQKFKKYSGTLGKKKNNRNQSSFYCADINNVNISVCRLLVFIQCNLQSLLSLTLL